MLGECTWPKVTQQASLQNRELNCYLLDPSPTATVFWLSDMQVNNCFKKKILEKERY